MKLELDDEDLEVTPEYLTEFKRGVYSALTSNTRYTAYLGPRRTLKRNYKTAGVTLVTQKAKHNITGKKNLQRLLTAIEEDSVFQWGVRVLSCWVEGEPIKYTTH